MLTSCKTCCCTCRSYCFVNNDVVSESRNLSLFCKFTVAFTSVVCAVTCFCTCSVLSFNVCNTCMKCYFDRIEVVITVYGSYCESCVFKSEICVVFACDLFSTVKLIRCVSGITVNNNLRACLQEKVEGTVLNLRIAATVVTNLNAGEVNDRILIVTFGTECNCCIFNDCSVNVFCKEDTLDVRVRSTVVTCCDNNLCFFLNCECKSTCHHCLFAVKVYVKYTVICAMTCDGNSCISGNYELDGGICSELMRIAVVSESACVTKLTACKSSTETVCSCEIEAVCLSKSRKNCVTRCACAIFIAMTNCCNKFSITYCTNLSCCTCCFRTCCMAKSINYCLSNLVVTS